MLNMLDIIENEIVSRYGTYGGSLSIKDGDSTVHPWEDNSPDYVIHCSKYVLEGIYQGALSRGFTLITYLPDENSPKHIPYSIETLITQGIKWKFPKIGVIQVIPTLVQGYVIEKTSIEDEYKLKIS